VSNSLDILHKYFLKFNIFQHIITKIYSVFKNKKFLNDKSFTRINKILFKANFILKSFQTFLFTEIVDKKFSIFFNSSENSNDIFEIIEYLEDFLKEINSVFTCKIVLQINKIHIKFAKLYFQTIAGDSDYLDYDNLKNNLEIFKLVDKIEKMCEELRYTVLEEHVIGMFHNFKFYLN